MPNSSTPFPSKFLCDYVKTYKKTTSEFWTMWDNGGKFAIKY